MRVKIGDFCFCDLEIGWMTLETIGHLFYTTSSFVYHFKAINEFKLELQSGKVHFGSNWRFVTFKFDLEKQQRTSNLLQ